MSSKDIAVSVRGLSKAYTIVHNAEKHTSLGEALAHRFKNPVQKVEKETFWALKDVEFDIKKGDVVGIIGRNGAGKSTLLKILSQITEPTTGEIKLYGRVGSLLEVGTGFHPELTGRENIFLNGAILGMRKSEIQRQFDAIVDFAEVEKFLDTPVKRYSSGMYVRLAFAVAAHLNPEILIVDEVLAVGDATFQKKCLGKMKDVAEGGRTILFVSHNMAAVRSLCSKSIFMKGGHVNLDADTDTEAAISTYLREDNASGAMINWNDQDAPQSPEVRLCKAYILDDKKEVAKSLDLRKEFTIGVEYQILKPLKGLRVGFFMQNAEGIPVCGSNDPEGSLKPVKNSEYYISHCTFPGYTLNAGSYSIRFGVDAPPNHISFITTPFCLNFIIEDVEGHGVHNERLPGILRPKLNWSVSQL